MHMSSFQGEVYALGSMGGSWANVFTCVYRGWASLMGHISREKVPVHKNKWLQPSVGLKETCFQASKTCLTVLPNEDNRSGGSVLSQAQEQLQGGYSGAMSKQWAWRPHFGVRTSVLDHRCPFWSQPYFKPSWEHLLHGFFPSSSLQTSKNPSQKSYWKT